MYLWRFFFMEKNKLFFVGMLAMLTFGLVLAGCPSDVDDSIDGDADSGRTLLGGSSVNVLASDTTADVIFTGANGLGLNIADFAVTGDSIISNVSVGGDNATVTVSFSANTSTASRSFTVSIATSSSLIKGTATVVITQAGDRKTLTAVQPAVSVAASATSASVAFTGATGVTGLTTADFTVTGGTFTSANVSVDTATVVVGFPAKSLSLNSLYLTETNKGAGKHKQAQIIFSLLFIAN
jgi:hypothetical protein